MRSLFVTKTSRSACATFRRHRGHPPRPHTSDGLSSGAAARRALQFARGSEGSGALKCSAGQRQEFWATVGNSIYIYIYIYTRHNYFGGTINCVSTPCRVAPFSLFPRGFGPLSPSGIAKTAEDTSLWASGTCKVPRFLDRTATRQLLDSY